MSTPHSRKPQHEQDTCGGAWVRRRFMFGEVEKLSGETLTAEEVQSIPRANLNALVNTGRLELWPMSKDEVDVSQYKSRFLVHRGNGRYDVIEGRRITDAPIPRDEALALQQQPPAAVQH